mgnify:CR=1 FL=1
MSRISWPYLRKALPDDCAGLIPVPSLVVAAMLSTLRLRFIGPATMSGRITDVAVLESDPTTIYIASATGGDVVIIPQGSDTNIDLDLQSKGSGSVLINGGAVASVEDDDTVLTGLVFT